RMASLSLYKDIESADGEITDDRLTLRECGIEGGPGMETPVRTLEARTPNRRAAAGRFLPPLGRLPTALVLRPSRARSQPVFTMFFDYRRKLRAGIARGCGAVEKTSGDCVPVFARSVVIVLRGSPTAPSRCPNVPSSLVRPPRAHSLHKRDADVRLGTNAMPTSAWQQAESRSRGIADWAVWCSAACTHAKSLREERRVERAGWGGARRSQMRPPRTALSSSSPPSGWEGAVPVRGSGERMEEARERAGEAAVAGLAGMGADPSGGTVYTV
ncbi:unnamed protein product, partial [Symbiodinium sp. KB8]